MLEEEVIISVYLMIQYVPLPSTAGHRSQFYSAEYETQVESVPPAFGSNANLSVPCVACYSSVRSTNIMIPGTMNCSSSSWTREYTMATSWDRMVVTSVKCLYECVDVNAEKIPDTGGNEDGTPFLPY